jgi:hypothetical protein
MTDTNSLLDAVDALTKERTEHMAQTDDDGKWLRTHTTQHPPLLTELKNAINPSSNTAAGSSALASTRNLIDSDALFEYGKMTSAIGDWCRIYKVPTTRDPITDLRRWYIGFELNPSDSGWHEKELRRWAATIRGILNPPTLTIPVEGACPVCLATEWGDIINGGGTQPVQVRVWVDEDSGAATGHTALCRACRAVWSGFDAVMELGEEVNEKKVRHAE